MVASGKTSPLWWSQFTVVGPSTRSVADAEKLTAAPPGPVASTVLSAGTVTAGGVVSTTVTSNESDPALPRESVEEQVTTVVPSAKTSPLWWSQFTVVGRSTRSVADAEKLTAAPPGPVASTVLSAGTGPQAAWCRERAH